MKEINMTRIVTIDHDLFKSKNNTTLSSFFDGGTLEREVIKKAHVTAFTLANQTAAHHPVRGVFAFEIDPSIGTQSLIGNIHAAVSQHLNVETPDLNSETLDSGDDVTPSIELLTDKAIRMYISAGGQSHTPELWEWDAVSKTMKQKSL